MERSYVMYHCHSWYSLLDSCTSPQEYVDLAVKNGQRALSISEHGRPLNWTEKWAACRKAGIRYIHSVEIYLTESLDKKVRDNYHTVLMARNMDGVRELNRLVSLSSRPDHFYYVNRLTFDEFLNISDNIISTSACLASPLNRLSPDHPRYEELANKYDFFEVQPHNCPEQKEYNLRLLDMAKKYGTLIIAGTDTHSSSQYKAECRQVLMESKHTSYGDEDYFDLTYKTYDELADAFRAQGVLSENDILDAMEMTNSLYDLTEELELDTGIKYPILYGSKENDAVRLEDTVKKKYQEKREAGIIPEHQDEAFREAIAEEMRVFGRLGMQGFMLSMSELVSWCREQGMAIGMGRGSVCGSRAAYVLDITDVNPEQWHTVFSRFANENRVEEGDIDIDCVDDDTPTIYKHIEEKFGMDKTARVASYGALQDKAVIETIGRCLKERWKASHESYDNDSPWELDDIARIKEEYDKNPSKTKRRYPDMFYYFPGLLGTKISLSEHPAGIVIAPVNLEEDYGVFEKDGERVLMLDMDCAHEVHLVKYDFLKLKTVKVIRDTCRYIGKPYPRAHEVNWDDRKVWQAMLQSPCGIFQFESAYAFKALRQFRPTSIPELSLVTAAIRPSGASYRESLLKRKQNRNSSALINDLLKDNLGYLVYQEDTIRFLQDVCGMSGSEADTVRRAITKKDEDKVNAALPAILDGYCRKSDLPKEAAEKEAKQFLQVIQDSSDYQFGKNHSIAYCMMSYLCAYYRYYYPAEFLTAFLNNAGNDDDIANGTQFAGERGIKITPPRFGVSKSGYYFDRDKGTITKGLSSVKYMGRAVADELFGLAHSDVPLGTFTDVLFGISSQTSLNTSQLDALIEMDFFEAYGKKSDLAEIAVLFYGIFKKGEAKLIRKDSIKDTVLADILNRHTEGQSADAKNYRLYGPCDVRDILTEYETGRKPAGSQETVEESVQSTGEHIHADEDSGQEVLTENKSLDEELDVHECHNGQRRVSLRTYAVEVAGIRRIYKENKVPYGYLATVRSKAGVSHECLISDKQFLRKRFGCGDMLILDVGKMKPAENNNWTVLEDYEVK